MYIRRIVTALVALSIGWAFADAQSLDFVNTEANHIKMNGDNWSRLRRDIADLEKLPDGKFQILQIGDSHIQADHSAAVVRRTLQSEFGNGGRGCIAALRMAGTNQPEDYRLTTGVEPNKRGRLLSKEWPAGMGVTGVAVKFKSPEQRLRVATNVESGGFKSVTLLHAKGPGYASAMIADSLMVGEPITPFATRYELADSTDSVTIATSFDSAFYGAYLLNQGAGVVFNAIGNNGACYSHYSLIPDFAEQTKLFSPSLIILSLGTNEAFGKESVDSIYADIDRLVKMLKEAHPRAKFLLTTPMECQKKVSRRVWRKVKNKKGKYVSVRRRVRSFVVNERIEEVRNVILRYGVENKIPVWDLYEVAGGKGASKEWIDNGLMNKRDHVHCLKGGYELRGSLLVDALLEQLRGGE